VTNPIFREHCGVTRDVVLNHRSQGRKHNLFAPRMYSACLGTAAGRELLALLPKVAAAIEQLCVACAQPTFNGKRPS